MSTNSSNFLRYSGWVLLIVAALLVWRLAGEGTGLWRYAQVQPRGVTPRGELAADEASTIALFREASVSVVHITTLSVRRDLLTLNLMQVPEGTGSGFIWDESGHVVTNYHVIQNADVARVSLADHSTWKAQRVGVAPDHDLAVLRIDAPKSRLRPIPIGASSDLQVGQKVFAIGNPFGLDQTLTTGIISALSREIESVTRRPIRGVIQTDAAINPGNSGGPLLDSARRLIGVNTAIYSPAGVSIGIGFAIPVDTVNRVVPQLVRYGKLIRPGLGVRLAEDRLAREFGLRGVLIVYVIAEGPAAKAGLRPTTQDARGQIRFGDVIVAIDGKRIETVNDLYLVLGEYQIGDRVTVTVLRPGGSYEAAVTLTESP